MLIWDRGQGLLVQISQADKVISLGKTLYHITSRLGVI